MFYLFIIKIQIFDYFTKTFLPKIASELCSAKFECFLPRQRVSKSLLPSRKHYDSMLEASNAPWILDLSNPQPQSRVFFLRKIWLCPFYDFTIVVNSIGGEQPRLFISCTKHFVLEYVPYFPPAHFALIFLGYFQKLQSFVHPVLCTIRAWSFVVISESWKRRRISESNALFRYYSLPFLLLCAYFESMSCNIFRSCTIFRFSSPFPHARFNYGAIILFSEKRRTE